MEDRGDVDISDTRWCVLECCPRYELKRQRNRTQMPVANEKRVPYSGKETADTNNNKKGEEKF